MPFDPLRELGKLFLIFGAVLLFVGALLTAGPKLPGWVGRLPGDLVVRRENFTLYFPLVTCLILSVVLSFLFWLLARLRQ